MLSSVQYDSIAQGTTFLWPGSFIVNSWANSDNVTTMMAYNDDRVSDFQHYHDLALYKVCVSCVLLCLLRLHDAR